MVAAESMDRLLSRESRRKTVEAVLRKNEKEEGEGEEKTKKWSEGIGNEEEERG